MSASAASCRALPNSSQWIEPAFLKSGPTSSRSP